MEFFKNWMFCVCTTLILAVIFSLLTPKGTMGRFYKTIISIFIFVSFIFPLANAKISDFKIDLPSFGNAYYESVKTAGKNNVEGIIVSKLEEKGINASADVEVNYNNDEIEIHKVIVFIPDINSKEEVKEFLLKELGLVVDVKYIGE